MKYLSFDPDPGNFDPKSGSYRKFNTGYLCKEAYIHTFGKHYDVIKKIP